MDLTISTVYKFLTEQYNREIGRIEPINGGEWSKAFFFETEGKKKVVRFSKLEDDFKRDEFAYRLVSKIIPVPEIEKMGKLKDGYFAISPKIEGEMIDHLKPKQMQEIWPQVFDLMSKMATIDTVKSTGFGGWDTQGNGTNKSWREYLTQRADGGPTSRTKGWRKKLESNKKALGAFEAGYEELLDLVGYCPENRQVIHNDLLHYNLIIREGRVAGVIDWGCAMYGDHLYDLAMFGFWQFYYPSMRGIEILDAAKEYFMGVGLDLTNFEERLKSYQIHTGLGGLIYTAFKENWKDMELTTNRLMEVINK